jgi:hypothetical protein
LLCSCGASIVVAQTKAPSAAASQATGNKPKAETSAGDKAITNKAGKPSVDEAASQPTAKKAAKPGSQSGAASAPKQ